MDLLRPTTSRALNGSRALAIAYAGQPHDERHIIMQSGFTYRVPLSLRLVAEMLLQRGIVVSYETIRGGHQGRAGLRSPLAPYG